MIPSPDPRVTQVNLGNDGRNRALSPEEVKSVDLLVCFKPEEAAVAAAEPEVVAAPEPEPVVEAVPAPVAAPEPVVAAVPEPTPEPVLAAAPPAAETMVSPGWGNFARVKSPLASTLSASQKKYIELYGSTGQVPL